MYPNVRMLLGGNLPFMMDLPEAMIGDSESGCFFLIRWVPDSAASSQL